MRAKMPTKMAPIQPKMAPMPIKTYAKGGVANADLKKMGRNMAKAKNQK
jgi:hypothetical protein